MTEPRRRARNPIRRLERWLVGIVMVVAAIVLERIVMRAVRKAGGKPPDMEPATRVITTRGIEVDAE
jgi:hypothetical protein